MKTCRVCKENKELDAFHKHPRTSDKRFSMCKACANAISRNRYEELKADPERYVVERAKANAKKREKVRELIKQRSKNKKL